MAGPTNPAALARYAQRCGVSASLRALRNLGSGIARLVTHDNPDEHFSAIARYCAAQGMPTHKTCKRRCRACESSTTT